MDSGYYLSELLSSDIIRDYRIVGKQYNYDTIRLRGISVQESPFDLSLVEEGEMILSTFSGLQQDTALMERFVCIVAMAKAAALFLTFYDPDFEIPEPVIKCAGEHELPLFQIPWEIRFKDITARINRQIFDRRISMYTVLQEELYNAYFDMKPIRHAVSIISEVFDRHSVIINSAGRAYASDGSETEKALPDTGLFKGESYTDDGGKRFFCFPISLGSSRAGTLLLSEETIHASETAGEEPDRAFMLQYVCFPLSLWFNRKAIEELTYRRLKNDFVKDLAFRKYDSFDEMLQQGNRLGFNLSLPYVCIVLRAVHSDCSGTGQYTYETTETENAIMKILEEAAEHRIMYAASGDHLEFIVYHEITGRNAAGEIDSYLARTENRIMNSFPEYRMYSGISEISLKTAELDRLFTNASLALHYCLNDNAVSEAEGSGRSGRGKGRGNAARYYYTYLDAKEAQIVSLLSRDEELLKTAGKIINELASYGRSREAGKVRAGNERTAERNNTGERENRIDLVGTLTAYIRSNHSISRTARELNIHRQSLLYRLDKIEEITEMKLGNHQDLFLLEIYCRVMSVF
ncbi:MAG: PucR family transcriptional regulator ligand-binding domain-containing protein [Clostridiales bacterium]|nr:PucR family transcriptional regulator ligand-binding domain-containing protein [Clostridiales bacterium]